MFCTNKLLAVLYAAPCIHWQQAMGSISLSVCVCVCVCVGRGVGGWVREREREREREGGGSVCVSHVLLRK